ncbi:CRISPR-associated DxTHG motif protein [Carnobacterium maltaromaticum]|nr:CRISPR-associated DxTHG motif protein [Carnobacterium maltaromaticum]MBC9810129.1 CRISPR-associated DxTHG motif protein [Carnobacterium maltaromaticum]
MKRVGLETTHSFNFITLIKSFSLR